MAFVDAFLGSIGVDQDTINKIMAMLDESADALDGGKPGEIRPTVFGGSETGMGLGSDTSLARQHVVAAINEMVAGMRGFRINVDKWQGDMSFTDDDAGSSLTRIQGSGDSSPVLLQAIQSASSCTTAPDFHAAPAGSTCDVETVSTTGGA